MFEQFITADLISFLAVFFFIFAVVFALMIKSRVLEETRSAVAAIAAVIGIATASYQPIASIIISILPIAALILVPIFFIMFVHSLFKKKEGESTDIFPLIVCIAIMLILLNVFWEKIADFVGISFVSAENMLWIIGIILILILFYAAFSVWGKEVK